WPLVDLLLDAGIRAMSMSINEHFGGAPFARPNLFQWAGPSGRTIPAFNNWHYGTGAWIGIGDASLDKLDELLPAVQQKLDAVEWPFDFIALQATTGGGDNQTVAPDLGRFIEQWNRRSDAL